ncbi:hypothetical protein VC81_07075 [Levilactobacillus spicheri]|uniref:Uncharacterized protein n=1 Tax=Levilactobacillus spicheri TaxID=216463 RepID=A0A0F3RVA6_9LACO|nr:hypothetical protein VC81_07075 [Levilactobacillus spicheri]
MKRKKRFNHSGVVPTTTILLAGVERLTISILDFRVVFLSMKHKKRLNHPGDQSGAAEPFSAGPIRGRSSLI